MINIGNEKFKKFCENRKWNIYNIPELPEVKTPDFFVVIKNEVIICEVKNLSKSGAERKDVKEFKNEESKVIGIHLDYNKEIDSVAKKINEANQQFKATESFNVPQILIIYSDRFFPLDKDVILRAMHGKVFQRLRIKTSKEISKNTSTNLSPLIIDRTLRKDKNNLVSAVGILNNKGGMLLLHNLWAKLFLPTSIFSNTKDINYVPEEIIFKEIKQT